MQIQTLSQMVNQSLHINPSLTWGVLDNELGLQEREWERTQREQWEPYDFKLSDPRFHVYERNLTRVRKHTAKGMDANDESSCLVTLPDLRQFVVPNLDCIRMLCHGDMMDSYITDRFSKICIMSLHKATSSLFQLFFKHLSMYLLQLPLFLRVKESSACCPPGFTDSEDADRNVVRGTWRDDIQGFCGGMANIGRTGSNMHTANAVSVRNAFCNYFNSPQGSVSWQLSHVRCTS